MKSDLGLVKDEQKIIGQESPSMGKDMEAEKKIWGLIYLNWNIGHTKGNVWEQEEWAMDHGRL